MDYLLEKGEPSSKEIAPTAQINHLADHVDDLFLALAAGDDLLGFIVEEDSLQLVADAAYAEILQIQEVLLATFSNAQSLDSKDGEYSSSSEDSQGKRPILEELFCKICMENKSISDLLEISKCDHFFCYACIGGYIESKVEESISIIKCPDPECGTGILEPHFCRKLVKEEVFDRWEINLCVSAIDEASKYYCPFQDCSALLISEGEEDMAEAECPHCHRMFCASCRVPWHAGVGCEDFQKLPEEDRGIEDRMLMSVAKESMWQRCPSCKFFVEKIDGCMFVMCRCGDTFCYGCGTMMTTNHYCERCRR